MHILCSFPPFQVLSTSTHFMQCGPLSLHKHFTQHDHLMGPLSQLQPLHPPAKSFAYSM